MGNSKFKITAAALVLFLAGCATVPGKTGGEQIETIDKLIERTLEDLYKQHPLAREEIASSAGYAIMNNKITKVPVFGAGAGYGVAIDNKTKERTYLRMSRLDFGAGWGARSVRPVLIFHDEKEFERIKHGAFEGTFGAEASAKVGETGVAGGAGSQDRKSDKGFKMYAITDAGVSATFSAALIRVKPIRLKETKE